VWTSIFIPPGEELEAKADPDNPVVIHLRWRGQELETAEPELTRSIHRPELISR
jgi:hypothetical protein